MAFADDVKLAKLAELNLGRVIAEWKYVCASYALPAAVKSRLPFEWPKYSRTQVRRVHSRVPLASVLLRWMDSSRRSRVWLLVAPHASGHGADKG